MTCKVNDFVTAEDLLRLNMKHIYVVAGIEGAAVFER